MSPLHNNTKIYNAVCLQKLMSSLPPFPIKVRQQTDEIRRFHIIHTLWIYFSHIPTLRKY